MTQIVDAGGEVATVTGGKLDVNASVSPASDTTATGNITAPSQSVTIAINGQSTVGIQVTGSFTGTLLFKASTDGSTYSPTTSVQLSNGTIVSSVTGPFNGQSNAAGLVSFQVVSTALSAGTAVVTLVASTSVGTIMLDNPLPAGTNVIGAVTQSGTWNVNNISGTVSLPTGAATAALQTQPGVDIGDVTVNNASGAAAVNIQDGGNSITVDNGGTFSVQATLAAETTKVIGTVNQGTSPWVTSNATTSVVGNGTAATAQRVTLASDSTGQVTLATGANTIGALTANQSVNVAQMNGVATSMGAGASGTGVQRVVLANDQGKTLLSTGGSASSSGNNTLVAAGTNRLKVYAFTLSTTSTTAMTCIFQSGASGTELWRVVLQAPTGVSTGANLVVQPPAWLFATASATLLNLNLSSANAVNWSISYFDEV